MLRSAAFLLVFLSALAAIPAAAQSPQTADNQSDGQFTATAIVTDNVDWIEAFNSPEPPRFDVPDAFRAGEMGAVAIAFSNAEPRDGMVRIECDIAAFDPQGATDALEGVVCYEGPYHGDGILHPTQLNLRFEIGPDDPAGLAGFRITVRDANSGRSVELNLEFIQGGG